MIPVCAVLSAAAYLSREWGEFRTMGPGVDVGSYDNDGRQETVYAFECGAGDGARWFIVADRWGNVGDGDTSALACEMFTDRLAVLRNG